VQFPYPYRKYQKDITENIGRAVENGSHLALEAGLGSGKTVCALYPSLSYSTANGKKVLYLTRTNSQQRQVIHELRKLNVLGMGIQGRQNLCPLFKGREELKHGSSEELSKLCSDRKKKVFQGDFSACPYFSKTLIADEKKIKKKLGKIPTVEEFSAYCRQRNLCAYELTKRFLVDCSLIVAPYIYFFNPQIRKSLLEWVGVGLEDIVLIVDEAHNLPDYARNMLTVQMSVQGLNSAANEAPKYGDQEVFNGLKTTAFCRLLLKIINKISEEYLMEDDALIPWSALKDDLLSELGASKKLERLIKNLLVYGEIVRENKRKRGRLPRSHIHHVGSFLESWLGVDEESYVRLVSDSKNPTLQLYCLDPREATGVIKKCHSSVHMSGTLHPLEEYRDSVGLPEDTDLKRYPSPFPPENRALFYLDDVTTKFEEFRKDENLSRLKKWIKLLSRVEKNTAFFFPSYEVMSEFLGLKRETNKRIFVESRGIKQDELINTIKKFKNSRNSLLFGVMGGRISEGIDFPDEELEIVVIVGIPYPKPSAKQKALVLYYDLKFNKGWEYVVRAPTIRKLRQTIGRLIRKEDDLGLAVILDKRASNFKVELEGAKKIHEPMSKINDFFTRI